MSNVIDELKVIFSAETGPLMAGLAGISQKLQEMQGMSGAAEASLQALAGAFSGGLSGVAEDAFSAGAGAGTAFARGLRTQAGSVRSAAAYISASAVSALGGRYTAGADAGGAEVSVGASSATRFDTSILSGGTGAAVSGGSRNIEVTVPLNVDGVKLGEACIRAMDRVSGMTGRAHIAI